MKPYRKEFDYTYTLGAFPTMELLRVRPKLARGVYLHSTFRDEAGVRALCAEKNVPVYDGDRAIARVSPKENVYVVGVFGKYEDTLERTAPHLVLVNPGDMGNLGNMLRTAAGLGFCNVAMIEPCADRFAPRAVRASMGALFRVNTRAYASFADYRAEFPEHTIYTFMLDGAHRLGTREPDLPSRYSLVFGNEATGLPPEFAQYGTSVFIPQSDAVDSLNITVAAAIGMYIFKQSESGNGGNER